MLGRSPLYWLDGYKVACLLDKSATAADIRWYLEQLKPGDFIFKKQAIKLREDDQLLFYFTGHGVANDALAEAVEGSPAGFVLPQDACISQVMDKSGEGGSDNSVATQFVHDALMDIPCRH